MIRRLVPLGLVVPAAIASVSCSSDQPSPQPESAGESSPAAGDAGAPAASVELSSPPVGIANVAGEPWVAQPDTGTVRLADGSEVEVGSAPLRLAATPDGVWVSVIGAGTVVRIDPATGAVDRRVRLKPAGSEPEGLAWDGTHLWVVDQEHDRVLTLDSDGSVVASYPTDSGPRLTSVGPTGTWVTNYGGTSLTRVRDGRAVTADLPGCVGPQGVAEAAGRVWVACTLNSTVIALDATTLKPVAEIPDVPDADAVVADGDTVYVVGQAGPTVHVIDPSSATTTETVALDEALPMGANVDAAVVGEELMVTYPSRIYSMPLPVGRG